MDIFQRNYLLHTHTQTTQFNEDLRMSKTPYELRFDLLESAKNHLVNKHFAEIDLIRQSGTLKNLPKVKFPSDEEIFELAIKYKEFIEKQ